MDVIKRALPYICAIVLALSFAAVWPVVDQSQQATKKHQRNRLASLQSVRARSFKKLEAKQADVLLVGNSMLGEGVNPALFEKLVKKKTAEIVLHGSASAVWYLVMKNVVPKLSYKPTTVVMFIRDYDLTVPDFRVGGRYRELVQAYTDGEDPELERLAYLNSMPYLQYLVYRASPLYRSRASLKETAESSVKSCVGAVLGLDMKGIDKRLRLVFADENLRPEVLSAQQLAAEDDEASSSDNFSDVVEASFLPRIIEAAKVTNIKLIFVRVKRRRHLEPNVEKPELVRYIADLKAYLAEQQIEFVDFTHEPRLKAEHYAAGDHLSRRYGKPLFTRLLARELTPRLGASASAAKN